MVLWIHTSQPLNGISIGSAVYAQLTDTNTNTEDGHPSQY